MAQDAEGAEFRLGDRALAVDGRLGSRLVATVFEAEDAIELAIGGELVKVKSTLYHRIPARAIDKVCSNCNAQPGEPCTQPTETGRTPVKWYHLAREQIS